MKVRVAPQFVERPIGRSDDRRAANEVTRAVALPFGCVGYATAEALQRLHERGSRRRSRIRRMRRQQAREQRAQQRAGAPTHIDWRHRTPPSLRLSTVRSRQSGRGSEYANDELSFDAAEAA